MTEPREEQARNPERPPALPDEDGWEDDDREPGADVHNDCRCGECCRHLIIEASVEDAEREPKIKERGDPIYLPAELTGTGEKELEGYLLNDKEKDYACTFLDQSTNLCSIYETRPWVCRVFDCDGEGKEQLIQLGIRPGGSRSR